MNSSAQKFVMKSSIYKSLICFRKYEMEFSDIDELHKNLVIFLLIMES